MKNIQTLTIKKYTSPLETIVRSDSQKTLGSVLSRVRSSHDAVFIFNDSDEFLGLVSPFKTLYSNNFPYTTKVSSILFNPPTITEKTFVSQVAEYMLATKMYALPVVNKQGELQSVIYGKDILQAVIKDPNLLDVVSETIDIHTPITAPITATVKEVFYTLKEKGVSRVMLVSDEGMLEGIVTRSDLMRTLIKPTAKMRFANEGTVAGYNSLAGEKKSRKSEPVRKYYTAMVDSLPDTASGKEILIHLVTSPHDSVVLINKKGKPTGFLSTRDILQALANIRPTERLPISVKRPTSSVSDKEFDQVMKHLEVFGKKLKKRIKIEKIEVSSEEPKSPEGHTKVYNITLLVTPVAGKSFVAVTKQRKYIDGIQEATKLIEKQIYRSGLSKRQTAKTQ